ncbi:MAG: response regulator [Elusimicrobiota bacterium]
MPTPKRILIIDDNAAIRMILTDMLETLGHQVVAEAADGAEALKHYTTQKPDIVTLDLSLSAVGGADGLSVLKSLRQSDAKARVIVISGNSQDKVRTLVDQAGACAFVSKPIKEDDLVQAIAKAAQS